MAKVKEIFRHIQARRGQVGLEIEVEGRRLPEALPKYWKREVDGSLRGESAEYVLKNPVMGDKVADALAVLAKGYKDNETRVDNDSPRTGVHVHINVQNMDMVKVFNMITLYHALEELMVRYCGKGRAGNLFCLRMKDADYLADYYLKALRNCGWGHLATDEIRYAGLNVTALNKFGSLEFRSMRGTDDFAMIKGWVDLLVKLKDSAELYENPVAIVESLSRDGELRFLETVLGEELAALVIADDADEVIREGIRSIQHICYDVDWEKVAENVPQDQEIGGLTLEELGIEEREPERPFEEPPQRRKTATPEVAEMWRNMTNGEKDRIRDRAAREFDGDLVRTLIANHNEMRGEF